MATLGGYLQRIFYHQRLEYPIILHYEPKRSGLRAWPWYAYDSLYYGGMLMGMQGLYTTQGSAYHHPNFLNTVRPTNSGPPAASVGC